MDTKIEVVGRGGDLQIRRHTTGGHLPRCTTYELGQYNLEQEE